MGLKNKEEGERRGHGEQQGEQQKGRKRREGGRELLFDRKSTNRQRQGRARGAEVREQTRTGTHTWEIKRRLAGGKLKDLACGPKLKFKTPPRAAQSKQTLGMN